MTFPFSTQTGPPLLQSMAPVRQTFDGVHALPATHATHVPPELQTPPGHAVPAGFVLPLAHTGTPLPQAMLPL
jgi:hypothetical protein